MEKPRTAVVDVLPLTAAGNGLNLWGHVTPHALADVLGGLGWTPRLQASAAI